jgi:HAD superfamily hydrolase (TIGR01509 family)
MNNIKGIVFDMDGTLIDSEHIHIEAWLFVFEKYRLPYVSSDINQWIGISDVNISKIIAAKYGDNWDWEQLLGDKRTYFQEVAQPKIGVIDGVYEALKTFSNLPLAVATMSNRVEAIKSLTVKEIINYFKVIVTADDVNKHKPDPECYIKACDILGLQPANCIGIEDSVSGVKASKAAGLFTIGVANTIDADMLSHADIVFQNSKEAFEWMYKTLDLNAG